MSTLCRFVSIFIALASPLATAHRSLGSSTLVSHRFGNKHAHVVWHGRRHQNYIVKDHLRSSGFLTTSDDGSREVQQIKILHITDSHISLLDDHKPESSRMFGAFEHTTDRSTDTPTTPQDEFKTLLRKAKEDGVDLIALGGDIVNYPSESTVAWVLEQIQQEAGGVPFIYTAGNHDWHLEGDHERAYDAQRGEQLNSTLRPLFDASVASADASHGPGAGRLYGHARVKGTDVIFIDNSNHQVTDEQLAFARAQFSDGEKAGDPVVLLLHMPLQLPGVDLEPKYVCGHPDWGAATDENWEVEGRARWPEGNAKSTGDFVGLVQSHSAPAGRLAAILTGHVHRDFSVPSGDSFTPGLAANSTSLACAAHHQGCGLALLSVDSSGAIASDATSHEATGALQYNTLDGAEGGFRMFTMHMGVPLAA